MPISQTAVIFRLSALGDIVLTTGVLDHWHRTRGLSFIYVTKPGPDEILQGHPAIEQIITLDKAELSGSAWLRRAGELARELRGRPLVDLHGTLRSRTLSLRWKGPVHRYPKLGLERRLYHRFGSAFLRRRLEQTCVTQRYALALDSTAPDAGQLLPKITLTPAEAAQGAVALSAATARNLETAQNQTQGETRPIIALHPYATHPDKAWPREHWLELAAKLSQAQIPWVVMGRDDSPLFPGDPRDLTGATTLRETCALLAAANVLVTNDSGPMHLAAGVGTPVAGLFGPTARAWGFYPQGRRDRVLERDLPCRPCTLHGDNQCSRRRKCLADITPDETLSAILSILSGGSA